MVQQEAGHKVLGEDYDFGPPQITFVITFVLLIAWAVSQVIHYRATNRWYAAKSHQAKSQTNAVGSPQSLSR